MANSPISKVLANISSFSEERALFYLYPFYLLFGPNLSLVRWLNIAMIAASGLSLYYVMKDSFKDLRIARLSLILFFLLMPLRYLYANYSTHDISGLFYLSLFTLIYTKSQRAFESNRLLSLSLWSILSGLLVVALAMARTLYTHIVLTILMIAVYHILRTCWTGTLAARLRKAAFLAIFLVVIPIGIGKTGVQIFGKMQRSVTNAGLFFVCNASHGQGLWKDVVKQGAYTQLVEEIPDLNYLGYGRLLSEPYYNFNSFVRMLMQKTDLLHDPQGEFWCFGGTSDGNAWKPSTLLLGVIFGTRWSLYVLAILGLIWLTKRRPQPGIATLTSFAVVFIILILLSQVQPRYSYSLHLYWSAAAAIGLNWICNALQGKSRNFPTFKRCFFLYAILCCVLIWLGLALIPRFLTWGFPSSNYLFVDLRGIVTSAASGSNVAPRAVLDITPVEHQPFSGIMELGTDCSGGKAKWMRKIKRGRRCHLMFFLGPIKESVDLQIQANGETVFELANAKAEKMRFVKTKEFKTAGDELLITLIVTRGLKESNSPVPLRVGIEYLMAIRE